MIVKNRLNGNKFEVTQNEFQKIIDQGNGYMYDIIDDDAPIEVKRMRENIVGKVDAKKKLNNKI